MNSLNRSSVVADGVSVIISFKLTLSYKSLPGLKNSSVNERNKLASLKVALFCALVLLKRAWIQTWA